jgi:hypothetical protein
VDQGHSGPTKRKPSDSYLRFAGLGFQLLATIGLSAWGGYALDQYVGLKFPAFLLTFVMLSFAGSMYMLYRGLNK